MMSALLAGAVPNAGAALSAIFRQIPSLAALACVFAGAFYAAFWLRYDGRLPPDCQRTLDALILPAVCLKLAVFSFFQIHRSWERPARDADFTELTKANVLGSFLLMLVYHLAYPTLSFRGSIVVLDLATTGLAIVGLRALIRAARQYLQTRQRRADENRESLAGVNDPGEALLRAMSHPLKTPHAVAVEDLLRRDPVQLDLDDIRQWVTGRVLMVTGSAGSIGGEICRQLVKFSPARLILVDRSENGQFYIARELSALAPELAFETCVADILDRERMEGLFQQFRPEIIFHAAAYKHVPLMEENPGEAVKNNVLGTRWLADLASEHGAESFVMISTDKAVNPSSVMGACKRAAELYIQSLAQRSACRFVTVRFGNVLDSVASVVPIFREQIRGGGPVTITDPRMLRYFMTIPEASQLVIQAGALGRGGEIFVLDMGEPVRIIDLAHDMIRLSGLKAGEDIEIEIIGLRPGEKLFEELYSPDERHLPTRHPKITIARSEPVDQFRIERMLARLQAVIGEPADVVRSELESAIPGYHSTDADGDVIFGMPGMQASAAVQGVGFDSEAA